MCVWGGGRGGGGGENVKRTHCITYKENEGHICAAGDNISRPENICLHKSVQTVMCYFVVRRSYIQLFH